MRARPSIVPALILILVGLFFLLNNAGVFKDLELDFDTLWPGFVVLGGLALLLRYLLGGDRDPGLIFVGTAAILIGLFLFLFTLNVELPWEFENLRGPIEWDDMAYLWPAFLLIAGFAFVLLAVFDRDGGAFGVGVVAMGVGVVAFVFTLGRPDGLEELAQYWPALLILLGAGLLLRPLLSRGRA